jgi:hypothetical protein
MNSTENGVRLVRLRFAETKSWRTYELDAALDPVLMQRLNDLAFAHGTEIVSTCAGHGDDDASRGDPTTRYGFAFAEVRFAIFFPSSNRLAAQQTRICIEVLARACAGEATIIETFHEPNVDRGSRIPRGRRLGRPLVSVRHNRPTAEAPDRAQPWRHQLVDRLQSRVGDDGCCTLPP